MPDLPMSEDQLLTGVLDLMRLFRWRYYHVRNSRRGITQGHSGFPDIVAIRPPRLMVVELKTQTGRLTFEQQSWLTDFEVVRQEKGIEAYVWRPCHWRDGSIEAILR